MSKDTDENQPVSIEDEIESVIASGEEKEAKDDDIKDEVEGTMDEVQAEGEPSGENRGEDIDASRNDAEGDGEESDETRNGVDIEDDGLQVETDSDSKIDEVEDKLEAPEHWSAPDRETFNEQEPKAQEWLLKRHKEMEGNMTRKSQEFAAAKRQSDAVDDALAPYKSEFSAAGLDNAGAVRQLAHWHDSLKTGGKEAILQLAGMYNIDMSEEDEYIDPNLAAIKKQLSDMQNLTAQQQQAAQREQRNQLERVIDEFATETDETGKLKHPHLNMLQEDIIMFLGRDETKNLSNAYKNAVLIHPEITSPKTTVSSGVVKEDQALKVKKAKKAALGIKSSGATKRKRVEMTLEEEIAAQMQN